jgi:hypothetical protein
MISVIHPNVYAMLIIIGDANKTKGSMASSPGFKCPDRDIAK